MNHLTKIVTVFFFFLLHLQIAGASDDFDIDLCTAETVRFEMVEIKDIKNGNGHRYYISGECGQIPFTLGAYYWIDANSYREVVRHQTRGPSYLIAKCDMSPVLFDDDCRVEWPVGPEGSVHRSYKSSIARSILNEEQLAELDARLEAARQHSLTTLQRSGEIEVPKNSSMQAVEPVPELPYTDWKPGVVGFKVYSPSEGEHYTVAPPLKIHVPERVDVQYLVNICQVPSENKQCEQHERLISAASLQCNHQETSCRYDGGFEIPMTANRHYMLIVRPVPLNYDPIIIEFDFPGIPKSTVVRKRAKVSQ